MKIQITPAHKLKFWMVGWIGWKMFNQQNGLSIQTHTASTDTASAVGASADTASAPYGPAHERRRAEGSVAVRMCEMG